MLPPTGDAPRFLELELANSESVTGLLWIWSLVPSINAIHITMHKKVPFTRAAIPTRLSNWVARDLKSTSPSVVLPKPPPPAYCAHSWSFYQQICSERLRNISPCLAKNSYRCLPISKQKTNCFYLTRPSITCASFLSCHFSCHTIGCS